MPPSSDPQQWPKVALIKRQEQRAIGVHLLGEMAVVLTAGPEGPGGRHPILHLEVGPAETLNVRRLIRQDGGSLFDGVEQPLDPLLLRRLPLVSMAADHWQMDYPPVRVHLTFEGEEPSANPLDLEHPLLIDAADAFVEALRKASRKPVAEVASTLGLSVAGARARIMKARQVGLLTPTAQGTTGGELTPYGVEMVARRRAAEGNTAPVLVTRKAPGERPLVMALVGDEAHIRSLLNQVQQKFLTASDSSSH